MIVKYPNIEKTVKEVVDDIKDFATGSQRFGSSMKIQNIVAPMQSGKTTCLQRTAQSLEPWEVFYTISQALDELNKQFENDMRSITNVSFFKMRGMKNPIHYEKLLDEMKEAIIDIPNQVLVLGIDESEAGILKNSVLHNFIENLGKDLPNTRICLITTGATPASLRNLENKLKVSIKHFKMNPGKGYVGLEELMEEGYLFDTSHFDEDETFQPHSEVMSALDEQLKKHKTGLYMLRATSRTKEQAEEWKKSLEIKYQTDVQKRKLMVVTVYGDNDGEQILDTLIKCEKKSFRKNVIVIVVGGLTMGYRLYEEPEKKWNLRFGYENSGRDMSSVQGIPGRMCGYYEHQKPMIFMRQSAVEEYLKVLDIDTPYEIVSPTASTSLSGAKFIERNYTPCEIVEDVDITKEIDSKMSNYKIQVSLGYPRDKARHNSNDSKDFVGQWNNSDVDNPNYDIISGTWRGVKDYCILIDRENKKARIVKKTGDRTRIKVKHNKSKDVNNSVWAQPSFAN